MSEMYPAGATTLTPVMLRHDWQVVDVQWFTPDLQFGPLPVYIGAVLTYTGQGDYKAYLGIGLGMDLETDLRMIAEHGAKLAPELAARFWPAINPWAAP